MIIFMTPGPLRHAGAQPRLHVMPRLASGRPRRHAAPRTSQRAFLPVVLALTLPRAAAGQADYQRAEQFLTWNALRLVTHDQVSPQWYPDSTRFWYRVHTTAGFVFVTVNPVLGLQAPLFDNAPLAQALTAAAHTAFDGAKRPFQSVEFHRDGHDERAIRVRPGNGGVRRH